MAIGRALRFQILRRDNHACTYCGRSAPEVKLTVDHVTPEALGGGSDPANLTTACEECNGGKSATPPDAASVAQVAQDALRWSRAVRWAAEDLLRQRDEQRERYDEFLAEWNSYTYTSGIKQYEVPLPADWQSSVGRFLVAGLPLALLLDCVRIAMGATGVPMDRRFNYMCGVAWNMVGDLQAHARGYLGETPTGKPSARDRLCAVLDRCDPALKPWEYDRIVLEFFDPVPTER